MMSDLYVGGCTCQNQVNFVPKDLKTLCNMMCDLFVCSAGGHFVPKDPKLQTLRNMMSDLYVWSAGGHVNPRLLVAAQQKVASRCQSQKYGMVSKIAKGKRSSFEDKRLKTLSSCKGSISLVRSGCTMVKEVVSKVRR